MSVVFYFIFQLLLKGSQSLYLTGPIVKQNRFLFPFYFVLYQRKSESIGAAVIFGVSHRVVCSSKQRNAAVALVQCVSTAPVCKLSTFVDSATVHLCYCPFYGQPVPFTQFTTLWDFWQIFRFLSLASQGKKQPTKSLDIRRRIYREKSIEEKKI